MDSRWSNGGLYYAVQQNPDAECDISHKLHESSRQSVKFPTRNSSDDAAIGLDEEDADDCKSEADDPQTDVVEASVVACQPMALRHKTVPVKSREHLFTRKNSWDRVCSNLDYLKVKTCREMSLDGAQTKSQCYLISPDEKFPTSSEHKISCVPLGGASASDETDEPNVKVKTSHGSISSFFEPKEIDFIEKTKFDDSAAINSKNPTCPSLSSPSKTVRNKSGSSRASLDDAPSLSRPVSLRNFSSQNCASTRLSYKSFSALESSSDSCTPGCSSDSAPASSPNPKPRASFKLVPDLEVPDPDEVQNKNLLQLAESFIKNNSLMRKPCKEYLDRASYRRAKLEHHLSLVSTVQGIDVCSLSCASVASYRTINEQSTFDLQDTPPKPVSRSSVRKSLNFENLKNSSKKNVSATSSLSINAGAGSVELFSLEDLLESTCEGDKTDVDSKSNSPVQLIKPLGDPNKSFSCNGFINESPRKSGNSPRKRTTELDSNGWQTYNASDLSTEKPDDSLKEDGAVGFVEAPFTNEWDDAPSPLSKTFNNSPMCKETNAKNTSSTSFEDDPEANSFTSGKTGKPSNLLSSSPIRKQSSLLATGNSSDVLDDYQPFDCDDPIISATDKSFSTPKKRDANASMYESSPRSGLNDFSGFNKGLNLSKHSQNSNGGKNSDFKNNSYSNNDYLNDVVFSKPSSYNDYNTDLDLITCDEDEWPKLGNDDDVSKTDYDDDNFGSVDAEPRCRELSMFDKDDVDTATHLNTSNSSSKSSQKNSRSFVRPFATLSGISPTYKKRNSFKFDEDPRFAPSEPRHNKDYDMDFDGDDVDQTNCGGYKNNNNSGCVSQSYRRSRRLHSANNSQYEDLFEFGTRDEDLEDPFSTSEDQTNSSAPQNGDATQRPVDDDDDEGPSFQLNKHIKLSKKGISLGAMGCELSIGRNVELNIFGKKTATLV
ncbi:uncharacterized protein LOC108670847 [Hyalella azteca]|uniref:Uncharacterized protein LOC108670847 n=1 Tax=Hyalella azteca TaxID=294128 RepID=A0A8B7NJJ6_HYAAZ|nr:uncharacterized protein LOC108670847 [Hyalella azteca]